MNFQINILVSSDWQVYKQIRLEALKEDPQAFGSSYEKERTFSEEQWKERVENRDNCILVATDNNVPTGILGYHLKGDGRDAHLWGMFVSKKQRGQGIGKKLIREIIKKAKKRRSVLMISLDVNPEQTSAVKLYESMGFIPAGTRNYLMGDGIERELLTMEMQLEKESMSLEQEDK